MFSRQQLSFSRRHKTVVLPRFAFCPWLLPVAFSALLGSSSMVFSETDAPAISNPSSTPFYQQLRRYRSNSTPDSNQRDSLYDRASSKFSIFDTLVIHPDEEEDVGFNYLWMQQQQLGYRHRDGSNAVGKLFKMSLKALYKGYYGRNSGGSITSDDDFSSSFSDLDYRMSVSDDKIKVGVKYEF